MMAMSAAALQNSVIGAFSSDMVVFPSAGRLDGECQPGAADDADLLPLGDRLARAGLTQLTVDLHLAEIACDPGDIADAADHLLVPGAHRPLTSFDGDTQNAHEKSRG